MKYTQLAHVPYSPRVFSTLLRWDRQGHYLPSRRGREERRCRVRQPSERRCQPVSGCNRIASTASGRPMLTAEALEAAAKQRTMLLTSVTKNMRGERRLCDLHPADSDEIEPHPP